MTRLAKVGTDDKIPEGLLPARLAQTALEELARDAVSVMITSGANVTLVKDDVNDSLVISATGGDAEAMRDTIGAALVGVNGVNVAVNDVADTITLSISGLTIAQVDGLQVTLDSKIDSLTYANALAGSRYTMLYNGTAWPASRPSARTDIYFDLIGGSEAVADPAWMLNGDAREYTV